MNEKQVELEDKRHEIERMLEQALIRYGVDRVHTLLGDAIFAMDFLAGFQTKEVIH